MNYLSIIFNKFTFLDLNFIFMTLYTFSYSETFCKVEKAALDNIEVYSLRIINIVIWRVKHIQKNIYNSLMSCS